MVSDTVCLTGNCAGQASDSTGEGAGAALAALAALAAGAAAEAGARGRVGAGAGEAACATAAAHDAAARASEGRISARRMGATARWPQVALPAVYFTLGRRLFSGPGRLDTTGELPLSIGRPAALCAHPDCRHAGLPDPGR